MKKRALYVFPGETVVRYGRKMTVSRRIFDKATVLSRDLWVGFYFDKRTEPEWYRFHEWVECV